MMSVVMFYTEAFNVILRPAIFMIEGMKNNGCFAFICEIYKQNLTKQQKKKYLITDIIYKSK